VQAPVLGQVKAPVPAAARGPIFTKPEDRAGEEAEAFASLSAIERLRSSLARADRRGGGSPDAEDVTYASGAPAQAEPAGPGPGTNVRVKIGANAVANGAAPESLSDRALLAAFEAIFSVPKEKALHRNPHFWGRKYESRRRHEIKAARLIDRLDRLRFWKR